MRLLILLVLTILLLPAAGQANPLTRALEASEPCKDLPHINRTGHARVDRATLSLNGDDISLTASGSIRCKTSDKAVVKSSASADFDLAGSGNLATCDFPTTSVTLKGMSAPLAVAQSAIEGVLEDLLRDALVDACRDVS